MGEFGLISRFHSVLEYRSPQTVLGLGDDCAAYLPTRRAVAGGGYSARIVDGVVGPEGGDVLVNSTTAYLKAMWRNP